MTLFEIDQHKRKIAVHFSKAAASYALHNNLQAQCARRLLAMLPIATGVSLDAGCGPGINTATLKQRASHYIGLDLAPGMLNQAQVNFPDDVFVLADVERLPLHPSCIETVFANLALQWVNDLAATLNQFMHCLKPSGQMVFSTVLGNSMVPLGSVFEQVTGLKRHNDFMTGQQLQEILAGLSRVRWQLQTQTIKVPYLSLRDMLADLKGVGATYNKNGSRYLRKTELIAAEKAIESYREVDGSLYLCWQIGFCRLIKN